MSPILRRTLYLAVAFALVAVTALGALLVHDRLNEPRYDYAPNEEPTALDAWEAPWTRAEAADEACGELAERWLVVGWDGADWWILLPLLEAGRLPNFSALLESGSYGALASFEPSISPALWTTMATGVSPPRHGILSFYNRKPRLARWRERLANFGRLERDLYSNTDRRVRALWNLMSERGREVMVLGYHNTFPVEEVEGMMVSNYLMQDSIAELMQMRADGGEEEFALSLVYPQTRLEEVLEIQEAVHRRAPQDIGRFVDLEDGELRAFLGRASELDRDGDQRPYFLLRAYAYDTIVAEIAERYLPEASPELAMVHFQSVDWAAHHFLYFHRPELYDDMPWPDETRRALETQLPRYRETVEAFYVYMDEWLGRLLAARAPGTAVMLLSDHGVGPGEDPDVPGYHDDAPPGILVMSGPGIRRGHRLRGATIYDVMPTLAAGLRLPLSDDLEGEVLADAFCDGAWSPAQAERVASYETGERYAPHVARPPELHRDLVDQLESLGYLQ